MGDDEDVVEDEADSAIEVCGSAGCAVVTGNEHAGVDVPAGALSQQVVIIIPGLPPTRESVSPLRH